MHAPARIAMLPVAALALSGALTFAQSAPAPATSTAPVPPPPHMHHMGPMAQSEMHEPMMQHGGFHSHMEMSGGFHMGPGGMWWKNPRIVERLSLTADQTKKMDDIVEQSRLQLIDLRANLEKQQVMLGPLMDVNPVDTAKASAQIDKVANARADLEKANAKMLLSIRGVLTPDQWTKLHERPSHDAQPAPNGAPGANAAPPAPGGGHWRGGRPGGPGTDNAAPPIDAQ